MAKAKRRGYGTVVACDIAGNGTFVDIGFSTATQPPGFEVEDVDGTTLDDDFEQFDPGISMAQEPTFSQFHDPNDASDQAGSEIDTLAESKAVVDWRWTFPGGKVWTVAAYVKRVAPDEVVNKEYQKRTVTLKTKELVART